MEESIKGKQNRRMYLTYRIEKLRADIEALENKLINGDNELQYGLWAIEPPALGKGDESVLQDNHRPSKLSKLLELSARTSAFKIENCSRKLRFSPGELYIYDCLLECRTSSVKCFVKFVETVQGPGDESGEISLMESEVIMLKGDPESLSNWILECCKTGDIALLVRGMVEFTELANNRRSILRSLYRRGQSGHLGKSSFTIIGEGDGVMVVGVGPKNVNLFSINWNINYFHAMKSMKSTFAVTLHQEDLQYESAEVFTALQRPFLTEEDLPLLWDAVADTLTSYS